ncbi:MAG TPA: hypothetical protein VE152_05005 [Acidimicrobiales bacterium]|nr:hypothetical protein [Acidimicrobiales bacterium]
MVRGLVDLGLVQRRPGGDCESWSLSEAAQRRLEELYPGGTDPHQHLGKIDLYIGYRCSRCQGFRATRNHHGRQLCDTCVQEEALTSD